jgi:hypothetical protein
MESIRQIIREVVGQVLNEEFFIRKTKAQDYDNLLDNKYKLLPKDWQNKEAHIKEMTSDEYIRKVASLQGTSYEEQFEYINSDSVDNIMLDMSSGVKYNMGYLDYTINSQEGRHRVVAAGKLGQKKIPVLVIDNIAHEEEEFSKTYDLNNSDEQRAFTDLFKDGEAVDEALSFILYRHTQLEDGEHITRYLRKDSWEHLPDHDWSEIPNELISIIKKEISKLSKEKIAQGIEDMGREAQDVEDLVHLVEYLQHELPELFKYLFSITHGVSKYMRNENNADIIKYFGEEDGIIIDYEWRNDTVKVYSEYGEDAIGEYDFGFWDEESEETYTLKPKVVKAWMEKYPNT